MASKELQQLKDMVKTKIEGRRSVPTGEIAFRYRCKEGGPCHSFAVINIPEIAVADTFLREGAVIGLHNHQPIEHLIVYKGELIVKTDKGEKEIQVGHVMSFYNQELHEVKAKKDTWLIAISIPREEGFPGGGENKS